jgi:hypothetical protein
MAVRVTEEVSEKVSADDFQVLEQKSYGRSGLVKRGC